jgi:site-specific recombinase XerD
MSIEEAIQGFLEVRRLDNCSPKTLSTYSQRLRYLSTWLRDKKGVTGVEQMKIEHLRGWMGYLKETLTYRGNPMSDESIHSYGQSMLAFCHWLEQEEMLEKPITTRFKLPRKEEKFIPTFTHEDVKKLLEACEAGSQYPDALRNALTARNRAIVSLFIDSGIRLSELVGLRLGDIDRGTHVILVHRKGNKWQQVPVSRDGFKPLHTYLTKHRKVLAGGIDVMRKDDPVFLADNGEPLTRWGVSMLFRRLKKKTGIDGHQVYPHNCRRYMATTQLAEGRSPLDVKRQMGHTTLKMTDKYASLSVEQLKRSHEQYSPLRASGKNSNREEGYGTGYWDA